MLGKVIVSAESSLRRAASSRNFTDTGLSAITTASAAINSLACRFNADSTRSAKNATVVTLITAINSATNKTRASPDFALRRSMRNESKNLFIPGSHRHFGVLFFGADDAGIDGQAAAAAARQAQIVGD